jgi:hypothetical protein
MSIGSPRWPVLTPATRLLDGHERLFVGSAGFEDRSLGWVRHVAGQKPLSQAWIFKYLQPKGTNKIAELSDALRGIGARTVSLVPYRVRTPERIEDPSPRWCSTSQP